VVLEGRDVVYFGSAGYLGLDQDPRVHRACQRGLERYGSHPGCSRAFSSTENLMLLEQEIAELVGAEAAVVLVNTSSCHLAAIPVLFGAPRTEMFIDVHAHATIHDAALNAQARGATIRVVDTERYEGLSRALSDSRAETRAVLVDGVYSMQGNCPDLPRLQRICDDTGAMLYVDDAHGFGVLGERGGGVAEAFDLGFENMILVAGLAKAMSQGGGFIAGSKLMVNIIKCEATPFIFAGPLPPHVVEALREGLRICRSEQGVALRRRLRALAVRVREELRALGFTVGEGSSPIVPVEIGDELSTLMAGHSLFEAGIYANSVVYPAVSRGAGIIRISLNAIHSDEDIAALIAAFRVLRAEMDSGGLLQKVGRQLGPLLGLAAGAR
jgi:7-keto-8-aminopelargonate synthetase-like enzyme